MNGLAKLHVFVSDKENPCQISARKWYVTVYDCGGHLLEFCGRKCLVVPTEENCARVTLEIPAGCYKVQAVWNFYEVGEVYSGNHFTDAAIVTVCCNESKCVTLFNPKQHICGVIYAAAINDSKHQLTAQGVKDADKIADAAIAAIQDWDAFLTRHDPTNTAPPLFEAGEMNVVDQALRNRVACESMEQSDQ